MKKRAIVLVAVLLISVMIFAGCESDASYSRNLTSVDHLRTSMGDDMLYPTVELDAGKVFFDAFKYKNAVTLPDGVKDNEILLLYIPAVSKEDYTDKRIDAEHEGVVELDEKAYRYSIKVTHNVAVDNPLFKSIAETPNEPEKFIGTMQYYIHGTDYATASLDKDKIKRVSVEDRKAKLDKDNTRDKKKLDKAGESAYYVSEIKDGILHFENKMDGQIIRYFVDGDSCAYELTVAINAGDVNDKVKGLTKENKAARTKANYDALLGMGRVAIDGFLASMMVG